MKMFCFVLEVLSVYAFISSPSVKTRSYLMIFIITFFLNLNIKLMDMFAMGIILFVCLFYKLVIFLS